MNKSSLTLSPGWHIPAALVLTFAVASPFLSTALPHASVLRQAGHTTLAGYYVALGVAFWVIALVILLPRTGNVSRFAFFRTLGKLPLLVRYFVAGGVALSLFWVGVLLEKIAA
ncbi:MAG: hypothetical protein V1809_00610 [Planctomycetota bacterium]